MEEGNLYKNMFVPDLQPQTLAFIACYTGIGPDAPMAEMQCRVAAKVFKVYAATCNSVVLMIIIKVKVCIAVNGSIP